MEDRRTFQAQVARLFTESLEVEVPESDTDLFEAGILDSLRFVELLAALEARFGIRVSVEELEIDDFRSLSRIAAFVAAKQIDLTGSPPPQQAPARA